MVNRIRKNSIIINNPELLSNFLHLPKPREEEKGNGISWRPSIVIE
jgi:hypothetical protein